MKILLGAIFTVAAVAGCGSSKSGYHPADGGPDGGGGDGATCPSGGMGQLVLAMTGLPAGVTPMVRVSGGASPMLLMAGVPVTVNAGGGYEVETRRVKTAPTAPSVIGKAFQATTTFDGCVKADTTTTAMVTFVQEPGSDKLWATASNPVTPIDGVVAAFAGSDLAATASKNPTVWLSKNTTGRGGGGAFDFYGNFWLAAGDVINRYSAATLGASNDTVPGAKIMQPTTATANFLAFDADGNLWAARGAPADEKSIVRYGAETLGTTDTPDVVIKSADLVNPRALAFDASGGLWVSDDESGKVLKFAAGRLGATFTGAADVVITTKTADAPPTPKAPYTAPNALAFDKMGNLWIGYLDHVVKLTPAQQSASGDILGPFAISVSSGTGMFAFDESGGLWMPGTAGVKRIPAAMLAGAGGDVTPDVVITSSQIGDAENIVINPAPTWSIIHDAF